MLQDKWKNGVVLSFDFDTSKLKEYYPLNDWRKAYKDIRKYLEEKEFAPLKDSDYKNEKLNQAEASLCILNFGEKNEWFYKCINKINISPNIEILDISDDVKSYLEEYHKEKEQELEVDTDFEMEM